MGSCGVLSCRDSKSGFNVSGFVSMLLHRLWYDPENKCGKLLATLLQTASILYEIGLKRDQRRLLKERARLSVPVISIGNIVTGGTGKTPMAVWLSRFLLENGFRPVVLSRGYGRKSREPALVPEAGDLSELSRSYGDEPVLMAERLPAVPVWVGPERLASGRSALKNGGVDIFILDDGFQHLSLNRDLEIVLLDCRHPFGNGFLLPRGPLREPVSSLHRADALVLTHADSVHKTTELKSNLRKFFPEKPVFACRHRLSGFRMETGGRVLPPDLVRGLKAVAFAGIARPEDFFQSLEEAGIVICASRCFADHYRYSGTDVLRIVEIASRSKAEMIVTTAKDFVRVPCWRETMMIAEMDLDFGSDHDLFCDFLLRKFRRAAADARDLLHAKARRREA